MKIEENLLIVNGTRVLLCMIMAYEKRFRECAQNRCDKPDSFHYVQIKTTLGDFELNVPGFLLEEQSDSADQVIALLDEYFQRKKGERNHD